MYRRDIRFKDPKPIDIMIRMLCILALAVLAAQIALGAPTKERNHTSHTVQNLVAGISSTRPAPAIAATPGRQARLDD